MNLPSLLVGCCVVLNMNLDIPYLQTR